MGFTWPHSPLIPLGSEQLPQVAVWVFAPASDFLPQPQPAPGCGDRSLLYRPQLPPTTSYQEVGLVSWPSSPASPAGLEPRQADGPCLPGCLRRSDQDTLEWGGVVVTGLVIFDKSFCL